MTPPKIFKSLYEFIKKIPLAEEIYFLFLQCKAGKNKYKLPHAPPNIMIDTTSLCNLNCVMCGTQRSVQKKGQMEMSLFRSIIDQATEMGTSNITLHTIGEPLLHPNIVEMVKYVKKKELYVNITTNGQLLTEEKARGLLEAGLDVLRVSIEGATEKTYSNIRRGGTLELLLKNLRTFNKIKEEKGVATNLVINSVYMKETAPETSAFFKLFVPIVKSPYNIFFKFIGNQAGISEEAMQNSAIFKVGNKVKSACHLFWDTLTVTWDGKVSPLLY